MESILKSIRVVDVTQVAAGPIVTSTLARFGAEVIHVESLRRLDPSRSPVIPHASGGPTDRPWNRAPVFNFLNANKLSATMDMTTDEGRDLFKALVRISDVVVENFRPGTMESFGCSYEELKEINPTIIVLSMPIFGSTGPEAKYRGYGLGVEMISGMANLTGYEGAPPMKSGIHHGDAVEAAHALGALLAALWYRRRTGRGQHIDSASSEANVCILGETMLGYSMNARAKPRMGNRHPFMAPHGSYSCHGDDRWVAIAVASDEEWQRLCGIMQSPELATDARFSSALARKENEDALDEIIGRWAAELEPWRVTDMLQSAGIAAGPVLDSREIFEDPHLNQRGFFQRVVHPEAGETICDPVRFKLLRTQSSIKTPAPCLGEHNQYVLRELLGIPESEIAVLEEKGIIGTVPIE